MILFVGDKVRLTKDYLKFRQGTSGHISGVDYTIDIIYVTFDRSIVSFSPQYFLEYCDYIPQLPPIPCPKVLEKWMIETRPYLEKKST